jgi:hypothetical protein
MSADPERWRRAGIKRAKEFSWRKAARATIAVYESM